MEKPCGCTAGFGEKARRNLRNPLPKRSEAMNRCPAVTIDSAYRTRPDLALVPHFYFHSPKPVISTDQREWRNPCISRMLVLRKKHTVLPCRSHGNCENALCCGLVRILPLSAFPINQAEVNRGGSFAVDPSHGHNAIRKRGAYYCP